MTMKKLKAPKQNTLLHTLEIVEAAADDLERRDGSTDPLVIALRTRAIRLRATTP